MLHEVHLIKCVLLSLPSFILDEDPVDSLSLAHGQERRSAIFSVILGCQETLIVVIRIETTLDHREDFGPNHGCRKSILLLVLRLLLTESFVKFLLENIEINFERKLLPRVDTIHCLIILVCLETTPSTVRVGFLFIPFLGFMVIDL